VKRRQAFNSVLTLSGVGKCNQNNVERAQDENLPGR
jgi:hypothetical protein